MKQKPNPVASQNIRIQQRQIERYTHAFTNILTLCACACDGGGGVCKCECDQTSIRPIHNVHCNTFTIIHLCCLSFFRAYLFSLLAVHSFIVRWCTRSTHPRACRGANHYWKANGHWKPLQNIERYWSFLTQVLKCIESSANLTFFAILSIHFNALSLFNSGWPLDAYRKYHTKRHTHTLTHTISKSTIFSSTETRMR